MSPAMQADIEALIAALAAFRHERSRVNALAHAMQRHIVEPGVSLSRREQTAIRLRSRLLQASLRDIQRVTEETGRDGICWEISFLSDYLPAFITTQE